MLEIIIITFWTVLVMTVAYKGGKSTGGDEHQEELEYLRLKVRNLESIMFSRKTPYDSVDDEVNDCIYVAGYCKDRNCPSYFNSNNSHFFLSEETEIPKIGVMPINKPKKAVKSGQKPLKAVKKVTKKTK